MADIYVNDGGSNTSPYDTWAKAATLLATALGVDAAGDSVYVDSTHIETTSGSVTWPMAGTAANPVRVVSANAGSGAPPNTSATGASIETTGTTTTSFTGSGYLQGIDFSIGSSNLAFTVSMGSGAATSQTFEDVSFTCPATSSAQGFTLGAEGTFAASCIRWLNVDWDPGRDNHVIRLRNADFEWNGGVVGGTPLAGPIFSFGATGRGGVARVSGVNFSACTTGVIFSAVASGVGSYTMSGCKVPASWSGDVYNGDPPPGFRAQMINCDGGDTNYRLWVKENSGSIRDETTIVRTGGASDGTTPLSWKMATNANANYLNVLTSPPIAIWNDTTGSSKTATIEIITDNVTLTNAEAYVTLEYLGTSGFPLTLFASDDVAGDNSGNILATPASQASSSETWTTTGLTTPVKQKLSVTFTPQEKGFLYAVVHLVKASTTVYVDPVITVT